MELPEGITQDTMPKYTYWKQEKYKTRNGETNFRYCFCIENHPAQQKGLVIHNAKTIKRWRGTSSSRISPLEKLNQVINKKQELDLLLEQYNKNN